MTGPTTEHWFDRLAPPQTRRQTLKGAIAAAALTLPFARSGQALAANPNGSGPHSCQKGCLYSAHQHAAQAYKTCRDEAVSDLVGGAITLHINPLFGVGPIAKATVQASRCRVNAEQVQKAFSWDCLQPDCPGFDPYEPPSSSAPGGGPCWACNDAGGKCCPSAGSPTGYGCCAASICCDPATGGCKLSGC